MPFGSEVNIRAEQPGFDRFLHVYTVTRENPQQDVVIAMEEERPSGSFGYKIV